MDAKELLLIGGVAVGGVGLLIYTSQRTTTSSGVDPGAAATQTAIVNANAAAGTTQAQETVALATLAEGYLTAHDANQTAVIVNGQNTSGADYIAGLGANATYQAALLGTASKIAATLAGAQTSQYADYVTGQSAQAATAASVTNDALNAATSQNIAQIAATTSTTNTTTQAAANTSIAQIAATTARAISADQTTAAVNAADRAASASKSNGFWGALASIGGDVAKAFAPVPNGAASANGSGIPDLSSASFGSWASNANSAFGLGSTTITNGGAGTGFGPVAAAGG